MRINSLPPSNWKDLQAQVARILSECGLKTEIERSIQTARGTANIDVYALDEAQTPSTVCLCECKHWATAVSKEKVLAFRSVVGDFGASWGFLISSGGFQSGAFDTAEFTNVKLWTWDEFEATWMDRWIEKRLRPKLYDAHERLCDYTEPLIGERVAKRADALTPERRQEFIEMRKNPALVLPAELALHYGAPWHSWMPNTKFNLPLSSRTPAWALSFAPPELTNTDSLRQFGDVLCDWIAEATEEFDKVFEGK